MKKLTYGDVADVLGDILKNEELAKRDVEFVVGVSRGGLFPAMVISTALVKPLVVAYIDKQDNVYFDRVEWIYGKKVLLVDDIVRTGKTMNKIKKLILASGAFSVVTLAPFYLETARQYAPDRGRMIREDMMFPWDK